MYLQHTRSLYRWGKSLGSRSRYSPYPYILQSGHITYLYVRATI